MNKFKKAIVSLIFILQFSAIAIAQPGNVSDSLLYYLKAIKGDKKNDSLYLKNATDILFRNNKEILLENTLINKELDRIKTKVDEKKYYNLILFFF